MEHTIHNKTIALAGIFQAAKIVNQLAYTGQADPEYAETSLNTLFNNDVQSIELVYGSRESLKLGFTTLVEHLSNPGQDPKTMQVTRYMVGLIHLQNQLSKDSKMGNKLIEAIDETGRQREYFGGTMNSTVISRLAEIYKDTISTLGPKIIIKGEESYLSNPEIAAQIRATLLAGIRSAVLWDQSGGGRFQLFFSRKKMIAEAKHLIGSNVVPLR